MPRVEPKGAGTKKPVKVHVFKPKQPKKGRKARKGKKGKKLRATSSRGHSGHTALQFHDHLPVDAEHPVSQGLPFGGVGSTGGAGARSVLELTGMSAGSSAAGLSGAILDLVGEGHLTVAHALAAWTHEQNRLANRAWRRPGGLQRMAGL